RPGIEGREGHELLWTGNRESSQHEGVEQAAQCRGRATSQRQRDDDGQGERRSPSQTAEGMPNVKAQRVPHAASLAACPADGWWGTTPRNRARRPPQPNRGSKSWASWAISALIRKIT